MSNNILSLNGRNAFSRRSFLIGTGAAAAVWMGLRPASAHAVTSDELQAQLDQAMAQLESMGNTLAELQNTLMESTDAVEATRSQISDLETQIEETSAQLSEKRASLSDRMVSSYKTGNNSILDLLLGSSSIEELTSNVYYLDKLAAADAQVISDVKTLGQQLEEQKTSLEAQQQEQEAQVAEIEESYESYQAEVASAQEYYNSLDSQVQQALAEEAAAAAAQAEAEAASSTGLAAAVSVVDNANSAAENNGTAVNTQTETRVPETSTDTSQEDSSSKSDSGSGSSSGSSSSSSSSSSGSAHWGIVSAAERYIGKPYKKWYSGTNYGPNADGYDCCGLVATAYHDCGYSLPYATTVSGLISYIKSRGNWKECNLSNYQSVLKPGDCLFCSTGHIVVYAGGNQMIHAPYLGSYVCYSTVYDCIGGGFGG